MECETFAGVLQACGGGLMDSMYKIGEIGIPKIKNGSKIEIGKDIGKITIMSDHRFNWFQKKMIKWCFGFNVTDYSEVE